MRKTTSIRQGIEVTMQIPAAIDVTLWTRGLLTVAVLALGLLAMGCSKKAGDSCEGAEAHCDGKKAILECHDAKLVRVECLGPKGCAEEHEGTEVQGGSVTSMYAVSCDISGNPVGSSCTDDEVRCAADKKTMVSCKDKKIVNRLCRGPLGCNELPDEVRCDTSIEVAGTPCEGETYACTEDKKQQLSCQTNVYALLAHCNGPKGCYAEDESTVGCDVGNQKLGDPCDSDGGGYACNMEANAILKCEGNKWIADDKCENKCVLEGDSIGCQ